MRLIHCLAVMGACCAVPVSALATPKCELVSIGAKKVVVSGQTTGSDTEFFCVLLKAEQGATLRLRITHSPRKDMAFNINGVVDNQDDFTFIAKEDEYRVDVYETFRAVKPTPFKLAVSVLKPAGRDKKAGRVEGDEAPLSIVQKLYNDFLAKSLDGIHSKKNRARYFVPALVRLYDADEAQACVSNIAATGQEAIHAAQIRKTLSIVEQSNDGKHAVIVSTYRNGGTPESFRYEFVKQGDVWKIADVVFPRGDRFSLSPCEVGRR